MKVTQRYQRTIFCLRFGWAVTGIVLLSVTSGLAQKTKSYNEDLSVNRPRFETVSDTPGKKAADSVKARVTPVKHINARVDAVLDSIDRLNLTKKFVDGFTLQVYAGQKQEDAMIARQKVRNETPDLIANINYIQPKFRVTIGAYFSRLEAQKDLMRVKHIFPNAILVPEKVLLK